MYTGSITIPRRVCVWVNYIGNRDLPRWSFSDVVVKDYYQTTTRARVTTAEYSVVLAVASYPTTQHNMMMML